MNKLIALTLNLVVLLPTIYSVSHLFHEDHQHCDDSSLHYHEHEYDCLTCDFLINQFDYKKEYSDNKITINYIDDVEVLFYSNFIKIDLDFITNRGPPTIM
ncbi:MAG: hypothetical protein CMC62_02275 [Flavobacteriaceae bacterium]|nr:hypothetical protein [Flavobacteriaceae bacterium]